MVADKPLDITATPGNPYISNAARLASVFSPVAESRDTPEKRLLDIIAKAQHYLRLSIAELKEDGYEATAVQLVAARFAVQAIGEISVSVHDNVRMKPPPVGIYPYGEDSLEIGTQSEILGRLSIIIFPSGEGELRMFKDGVCAPPRKLPRVRVP